MAIRFVVHQKLWKYKHRLGIFAATTHLLDSGELAAEHRAQVEELMEWFRLNLPIPPSSERDKRAIYWYRDSATAHIRRSWELTALLTANGYDVEMIKLSDSGHIVYQDKFQFGLIPQSRKAI